MKDLIAKFVKYAFVANIILALRALFLIVFSGFHFLPVTFLIVHVALAMFLIRLEPADHHEHEVLK